MKIYIVGLGPGAPADMTGRALAALCASDTIVGYDGYIALIRDRIGGKEVLSTPMRREVERCRLALQKAREGKTVAVVCSGDAGVYGMAGPIYELSKEYPEVTIEVVPGVTAACSGAALLGAPLTHDFAVISLSDLLTPWETVEKRLDAAAAADFCICLYNPASKQRRDYLKKACAVLLRHRSPKTAAGYVRNIGRDGEQTVLTTLGQLGEVQADMVTTVFVGNRQTMQINGKMVTPRGYRDV